MAFTHELKATTDGYHRATCGTAHRTLEAATACIVKRYGLCYELGSVEMYPFTHDTWEIIADSRDTVHNPALRIWTA